MLTDTIDLPCDLCPGTNPFEESDLDDGARRAIREVFAGLSEKDLQGWGE